MVIPGASDALFLSGTDKHVGTVKSLVQRVPTSVTSVLTAKWRQSVVWATNFSLGICHANLSEERAKS